MQSRCFLKKKCKPTEVNLLALHTKSYWKRKISQQISDIEKGKEFPDRFPGNTDSIGIEIVGLAIDVKGKPEPVYEAVNDKQNDSLRWLIAELASTFKVSMTEIYRHPDVGRKNETEAGTAEWK
nr:N-acetylmuramoyl-L-alanine amidase [Rosenbergiella gaditana]